MQILDFPADMAELHIILKLANQTYSGYRNALETIQFSSLTSIYLLNGGLYKIFFGLLF